MESSRVRGYFNMQVSNECDSNSGYEGGGMERLEIYLGVRNGRNYLQIGVWEGKGKGRGGRNDGGYVGGEASSKGTWFACSLKFNWSK